MIQIDEAQVCLNQAQIYWQKQEWQSTIQACAEALVLNQKLTDAHKLMGDALQKIGKTKEALGFYLQAISIEPNFAEVYANLGYLYAKQKQWSQAIVHYQKAIQVKPELVGVYRQLAKIYQKLQQSEKAQFYLTQAHEIEKRSTKVLSSSLERQQSSTSAINSVQSLDEYLRQGQLLKQQGELQPALEQYFQAAKLEPRIDIYQKIVALCEQLELWSEAAKYCQVILKLTNADLGASKTNSQVTPLQTNQQSSKSFAEEAEHHYSLGTLHTKKQEWSEAVESYQKAIALNPKMAKAYRDLARAQTQLGDKKQSAEHLLKAISLDNENVSAAEYLELGKNLVSWGKQQSALTCYRRAIARQPELIAAYLGLGELLVQLGARKEAIACYVESLKYGQDNPLLYYRLGSLYRLQDQWSQATLCYQRATQYDAKNSAAFHQLGEVLTHQELWSEAIVAYRQAIKLNSDFSWSYNNLGYALIQLEQWSEAVPIYQQAIKLNPQFPWSYYNLAEAYGKLDRWDRAVDFYQQAAKIQPDLPKIKLMLGDALFRRSQQDREVALKHFQLAIQQNPDDPEVYHHALAIDKTNLKFYLKLGDVLVQSGEIDQAIVTYQMALQIQPKSGAAMARLQEILLRQDPNCNVQQYISNGLSTPVKVEYSQPDLKSLGVELQQILPHSNNPQVSIIIPVYNQLNYTLDCLKAIATNVHKSTAIEIILVNDCSTDETRNILEPISAINLVNNQSNQGFIYSCNQGASLAKGKYLYFLNNDTQIKPNCIESLMEVLDQDNQVGAVGSKLIYAQGALQEAGGIIWQDASGWNYGRQDNANAPEYNYLRPVDYCSAASLMVRTEIFERLKGFEQDFAPAYYEDTDLCFAIRHQLGLKVMYQPQSEVIHYEGISSGTSTSNGTKKYQLVNGVKFRQKWQNVLNGQYLPNTGIANVPLASRKYLGNKTILVIDGYMPCYDKESGSRRLFELLKIFKSLNFHVIFAADNGYKAEPYTSVMENLQIEVLYTQQGYGKTIEQQINERLSLIDVAWICRPELNEKYTSLIKSKQSIKVIYDTIDLHYLRLKRAWELSAKQSPDSEKNWQQMQATELRLASQADLTITVTPIEQEILQAQLEPKETTSVDKVAVVPNIHFPYQGDIPSFHERSGILFIGSYNHPPNVDAVLWLCQKIMPLVWQKQPDIKVTLIGSNVTPEVKALAGDKITVTGYIDDVSSYFLSHKLSVSPLRYGAGMKGKIGQSLEYSLPVVSTEIGTEGMNLQPEEHILEANNTEDFAEQILRLYNDVNLWNSLSFNSWQAIAPYTPETVKQSINELMQGLIEY